MKLYDGLFSHYRIVSALSIQELCCWWNFAIIEVLGCYCVTHINQCQTIIVLFTSSCASYVITTWYVRKYVQVYIILYIRTVWT